MIVMFFVFDSENKYVWEKVISFIVGNLSYAFSLQSKGFCK